MAGALGYPVIVKAAMGGGGRGMRVVESADGLDPALDQARSEAQNAFGCPDVFLEKFIRRAKHIEVQLLGDRHGHLVHLHERDCSIQRRHQKVIEIAPASNLDPFVRDAICQAALAIGRKVGYENAGTVEFLVDDESGTFYFIEVNPRLQVEHTITEIVTGIDIVKSQILIAQGRELADPDIGIAGQESIQAQGHAIQCRITSEDPTNNFTPDYGRITHYRSSGGPGLRLDGGSTTTGAIITPFYDSLLVKISAYARRFKDAALRMERALQEYRIRGVKTNIPFLLNVVTHPTFLEGRCTTRFIDQTPELFRFAQRQDRATKLLTYAAEITVNGFPGVKRSSSLDSRFPSPSRRHTTASSGSPMARASGSWPWAPGVLAVDSRARTLACHRHDLPRRPPVAAGNPASHARHAPRGRGLRAPLPNLFSIEMWGGATFDTAMRFLKEDPWERLAQLREKIPNILFQMLIRGSNAVGYTSYPDNVVVAFVKEAAAAGIDLFRVFDSLNWVPNMERTVEAVREAGALARRPSATPAISSIPDAPSTTSSTISRWPESWRSEGRT